MEWCLISERLPLNQKMSNSSGFLFHYGHFILDLALPFLKEFSSKKIAKLYLPPNSCFGTMAPIFHALFPGIKIVNVENPAAVQDKQKLVIRGYCRLNFHTDLIEETNLFHKYVTDMAFECLKETNKKWPEVILIQRGKTALHKGHLNGAGRRNIRNHDAVKQILTNKYGLNFENLILENMDFFTQVCYFYYARIVIGQYGSGLVNILWMKPGTGCIEFTMPGLDKRDPVFVKCCEARSIKNYPIICSAANSTSWLVPINIFKQTLEKCDTEAGGELVVA